MSKFNDLRKRGISLLTAAFTVVSLSGCVEVPEDYPEEYYYIGQESNHFVDFHKKVIRNGEAVTVYSGKNVFLAFDKETYDVKEYVYTYTTLTAQIYDLSTGYLVVGANAFSSPYEDGVSNWNILEKENYLVFFKEISDYIEDEELKEWYSLDEIKELEPRIIESLKIINEYESKVKVK
mgnify:CR=1 FL=1